MSPSGKPAVYFIVVALADEGYFEGIANHAVYYPIFAHIGPAVSFAAVL